MKIKIFSKKDNLIELEERVNDFIKDKTIIDIKQSESMSSKGWSVTITVVYED